MTKLRIILICLLLALAGARVEAALFGGEGKAFEAASKSYQLKMWERAEKEFAEFVKDHPKSDKVAEALLWQAQAQFEQGKFAAVVELLSLRLSQAGSLQDQFLYWIATAQFKGTNYPAAAASFGRLAREFTDSSRRLEASVNEAASFAKLGDWTNVVELLRKTNGAFRLAATTAQGSEMVARGFLLQAEGQLARQQYPDAVASLSLKKVTEGLSPELEWERRSLLCRTLVAWGRVDEAAEESAGMITVAEKARSWRLLSDSVVFRADLLEQLGRPEEAIATLQKNLTNAPVARQRQALVRITALSIQQNQLDEATRTLESYLNQFTNAVAADVAWLTLGEIHLKQYVGGLATNSVNGVGSNHLAAAMSCFQRVLKEFPGNAYLGKAQLNLGWCYWLENKFAESAAAFDLAVKGLKRLPVSEDLAVAQFKLADTQFALKNFPEALANYREVLLLATNWPTVNAALRTPASYQALRASLELTNAAGAEEAMRGILAEEPAGQAATRSLLLVAQAYVDAKQPGEAQRLFDEFTRLFPESDLSPEVELLAARVREEQGDWVAVGAAYDQWLGRYATNRLRAQVEFQRALAAAGAGEEAEALRRFTNFVARYPTNELAPRAQWWLADYYFGREEFVAAEIGYKDLFNNWPKSELAYEARMMAGRAAVRRTDYREASEHFISLTRDTNCPPGLKAQALFALGGTFMFWAPVSTNKVEKMEKYEEARRVFGVITDLYRTNELAAAAWGEIGNCCLQLAVTDAAYYNTASNAYHQALVFPAAAGDVRCLAKWGLATVLEKQALLTNGEEQLKLLKQARDHNLDVYWGKQFEEAPNFFWRKKVGLEAARLSESLNEWPQAIEVYRDLLRKKLGPADFLEKKIAAAEKQWHPAGKND